MICPRCNRNLKTFVRGYCSSCYVYLLNHGQITKIIKEPIPEKFTGEQEEIFNGLMLGDGCINPNIRSVKLNPRLTNTRQLSDFDYLKWQYEKFKYFYSTPPKESSYLDKRTNKNYLNCYSNSRTGQIFHEYYNLWYPNGIKIVNKNIKLTPLTILVWFLDDGSIVRSGKNALTIKFATDGFAVSDVEFLADLLFKYTDEIFNVYMNDKGPILKAPTLAAVKIIKTIDPIFLSCMERKRTWSEFNFNYVKNSNKFGAYNVKKEK